jgi:hypothetical protein
MLKSQLYNILKSQLYGMGCLKKPIIRDGIVKKPLIREWMLKSQFMRYSYIAHMCIVKSVNIIAKYRKANKAVSNIKSQEKKATSRVIHILCICV